ncbi:hypothetical protein [Candidatus Magnetobacterium casense]|uniref:Uncharacterized protein n=1 Tax=Candidatus Magnetobacterium casense TaxID=1455061 RepID=A0ABS6S2G0_9BACT|nr:hypothetical protein [Candidatus Magnetobacterium casensis]MBV6343025.1 hypothetical protein [Candidatus Magnetobacterium casensis]
MNLCRDCVHWHWTGDFRGNCFIHRWEHDKYSQDAVPSDMGCKEYAVRCAERVAAAKEG